MTRSFLAGRAVALGWLKSGTYRNSSTATLVLTAITTKAVDLHQFGNWLVAAYFCIVAAVPRR
jgi:hypothetical protein